MLVLQLALLVGVGRLALADSIAVTDPCTTPPGLMGDLNADCRYNLLDVVMLINAVFAFPHDPYPKNGDVNCDNTVDVFDVIALIDFIFAKGPALQPCSQPGR
jgi:hypothetical protein